MKRKSIIKLFILLGIVFVLFYFRNYINIDAMKNLLNNIRANPFAPLIFVIVYALAVTLIVPASALTLLSVPMFGFWQGLLLTVLGSNLGCHLSYIIGHSLGEETVRKFIKSGSFIEKAQQKAQQNGFIFMMYVRLIPLFPFAAVNYLSAIIGIRYRDYTIATFLGMLPGSIVYVYLAHTATNIKDNPLGIIVSIAILILFTLIVALLKKRVNK